MIHLHLVGILFEAICRVHDCAAFGLDVGFFHPCTDLSLEQVPESILLAQTALSLLAKIKHSNLSILIKRIVSTI